jgi:hypothetical protein
MILKTLKEFIQVTQLKRGASAEQVTTAAQKYNVGDELFADLIGYYLLEPEQLNK